MGNGVQAYCSTPYLWSTGFVIVKIEIDDISDLAATAVNEPVVSVKRQWTTNPAHQPRHGTAQISHSSQEGATSIQHDTQCMDKIPEGWWDHITLPIRQIQFAMGLA